VKARALGCVAAVLLASGVRPLPASAQTTATPSAAIQARSAPTQERTTVDAALETRQAQAWQLTTEEWARYRQLMAESPLGIHSPQLDPLTALGIEARSEQERQRYAELQVRHEAARVERLLTYQRAFDEAWQRLYPDMPRLALPDPTPPILSAAAPADTRLALFVRDGCEACDRRVHELQAAGQGFDVYFVGSLGDDARIRAWARRVGLDAKHVQRGHITLNHDGGRWLALALEGALPATVRQVDGRWQRLP